MSAQKTIMQKLHDVADRVAANMPGGFADTLSDMAIEAILNGTGSPQWRAYMETIVGADSPKQLARLTFQDDKKDDPWVRRSNVYIVSNAVCGPGTTTRTFERVDDSIDEGL